MSSVNICKLPLKLIQRVSIIGSNFHNWKALQMKINSLTLESLSKVRMERNGFLCASVLFIFFKCNIKRTRDTSKHIWSNITLWSIVCADLTATTPQGMGVRHLSFGSPFLFLSSRRLPWPVLLDKSSLGRNLLSGSSHKGEK